MLDIAEDKQNLQHTTQPGHIRHKSKFLNLHFLLQNYQLITRLRAHMSWVPCGASGQPAFRAFSRPGQEEILLSAKPWGRSFPHQSSFSLLHV